jgi:hypothetical protein
VFKIDDRVRVVKNNYGPKNDHKIGMIGSVISPIEDDDTIFVVLDNFDIIQVCDLDELELV